MPDDTAEQCCAAMICCNLAKAIKTLGKWLARHVHGLHTDTSVAVATEIHRSFDLVPKGLLAPSIDYIHEHPDATTIPPELLAPLVAYVHAHPYE